MKNVTVSLDDEIYRRARARAAELGSSLSALVRAHLNQLGSEETEFERLKRLERETVATIHGFSGSDRLTREQLYDEACGLVEDVRPAA